MTCGAVTMAFVIPNHSAEKDYVCGCSSVKQMTKCLVLDLKCDIILVCTEICINNYKNTAISDYYLLPDRKITL